MQGGACGVRREAVVRAKWELEGASGETETDMTGSVTLGRSHSSWALGIRRSLPTLPTPLDSSED